MRSRMPPNPHHACCVASKPLHVLGLCLTRFSPCALDASPLLNTHHENNASMKFTFSRGSNARVDCNCDPLQSISRAKLVEHPRVRLHQTHQVLCFEHAERSQICAGFGKAIQFVGAAKG